MKLGFRVPQSPSRLLMRFVLSIVELAGGGICLGEGPAQDDDLSGPQGCGIALKALRRFDPALLGSRRRINGV